jgi:predicted alpha/beta hydrolase
MKVRTEDGWILHADHLPNDGAVVVLGHAMMVDRRTMRGLSAALHGHGLEILSFDARGHGESGPNAAQGARFGYSDIVRYDIPAMVRAARAIAGERKVIVLGHSLVGHAAMISAGLDPIDAPDGIVGLAPNLWAPHLEPSVAVRIIKSAMLHAWAAMSRARGFFDAPALGAGTNPEPDRYVQEFLQMWTTDRLGDRDDYEAALSRATIPVLAYSSRGDRLLARPEAVERFLRPLSRCEHRVIDRIDHMGLVLDDRARPMWDEIAAWIRQ